MQTIPLQNIPNQSLTIQLDQNIFNLVFKEIDGLMAVTIFKNNELIVSGQRMVLGYPLIPYRYLEDGNFTMTSTDEDYPYYTKFGISQFLIYASNDELEVIRGSN